MKTINIKHAIFLDVDLDESPKKRWGKVVEQTGDQICEVVGETVAFCEEYLSEVPASIRPLYRLAIHGSAGLTGRTVGLVATMFRQEYQSEIKAIARQAGISYPKLLLGNLMYDVGQIWTHSLPSACSSYSCNLPGGVPVLARNLDWAIPKSLGRHTVVLRFHRGKRS